MSRGGKRDGAGRKAGVANKVTLEFKEAVTKLLNDCTENFQAWLMEVAKEDPAKAFDILSKLGEYAFPKLARTELANAPGETFKTETITESDQQILERYIAQRGTKNSDGKSLN
jgi:hypothetical protein